MNIKATQQAWYMIQKLEKAGSLPQKGPSCRSGASGTSAAASRLLSGHARRDEKERCTAETETEAAENQKTEEEREKAES